MTKKQQRQFIFDKSGGKCFYCGCDLTGTKWQADHFHPVIRDPLSRKPQYPELDVIENLVPSCAPCNNFKLASSIEGFRWNVNEQFVNTLKNSTGLRQLNRLGLVEFKSDNPVTFWFERNGIVMVSRHKLMGLSIKVSDIIWKYDEVESAYFAITGDAGVTIRRYDNSYIVTMTRCGDWERLGQTTIDYQNINHVKDLAADWALSLL